MAQQDTTAAGSGTESAALDALRNRAITGLLVNESNPAASAGVVGFSFWQGYIKALQDVRNGAGSTLAGMDEARLGYEPAGHLKAAFAALAECAESATFAQVQQILAAQGVQVAGQPVAHGQFNAAQQLKDGVVAVVNPHDEHAAAGIDCNDGAIHGASPCGVNAATVALEGGAA